jgi:hypothetical protein
LSHASIRKSPAPAWYRGRGCAGLRVLSRGQAGRGPVRKLCRIVHELCMPEGCGTFEERSHFSITHLPYEPYG